MRLSAIALALIALAGEAAADRTPGPHVWSPPVGGLQLAVVIDPDLTAHLTLTNVSHRPITVLTDVRAGNERHYDWFELELGWPTRDASGACTTRGHAVLVLADARKKAARETTTLEPSQSVTVDVSITAWARRPVNHGLELGGNFYKVVGRYHVSGEPGVWNGALEVPPAELHALDQQRADACPANPGWDKF